MIHILFPLIFVAIASAASVKTATPGECFGKPDFESFIKCWADFIAKPDSITDKDWLSVKPSDQERQDWKVLIGQMLSSDGTCRTLKVPQSLNDSYKIDVFEDKVNKTNFCILYETTITGNRFQKAWGIVIVPYYQNWTRVNIHYSAAHPITDLNVDYQATSVFFRTRGRSVIVSGAARNANSNRSDCQQGKDNYRTDGAHDNTTMFHTALIATKTWQDKQSKKCLPKNCAFVQFHGKDTTACPGDSVFISTATIPNDKLYSDQQASVNRLKNAWRRNAPTNWTANTPLDSPSCKLGGGTNIFSRFMNGVQVGQECKSQANSSMGFFIHVEQDITIRDPKGPAYDYWTKSILDAF